MSLLLIRERCIVLHVSSFFSSSSFVEDVNSQKAGGLDFMPLRHEHCIGKLIYSSISNIFLCFEYFLEVFFLIKHKWLIENTIKGGH